MHSARLLFCVICRCQNARTFTQSFRVQQKLNVSSFSTTVIRGVSANKRSFTDETDSYVDQDNEFSSKLMSCDVSETSSHNKQLNANRRRKRREVLEKTFRSEEGVEWRILSENDNKFLTIMADMKNKRKREEMGKILVEGRRLVSEAITAGLKLNGLYFTE
uniref:MRM3-like substrate binding domain-containing protein n=1 Tax=Romanomermis culicivorax TaxID=13658 RepID=A0A915HWG5_ROMCU